MPGPYKMSDGEKNQIIDALGCVADANEGSLGTVHLSEPHYDFICEFVGDIPVVNEGAREVKCEDLCLMVAELRGKTAPPKAVSKKEKKAKQE